MRAFRRFASDHHDFIHDIAYDHYGKRLATCSSDQKVKVWDQSVSGDWTCVAELKAHSGSVHKLSWAHPEFGQVLASCSADRVVNIYEEQIDSRTSARTWKKQGRLVDSRDSVQDIQFAPRHLGLKLATCSAEGRIRIYEATDIMNLSVWPLVEEFEAAKTGANCLSWNSSPFEPPMLAVGTENAVKIWEYQGKLQRWQVMCDLEGHEDNVNDVAWAPNMGRSYHLIATACKDQFVRIYKLVINKAKGRYDVSLVAKLGHHKAEVWRVSWNMSGTMVASTGDDGVARLWKADYRGQWHPTLTAQPNLHSGTSTAFTSAHTSSNNLVGQGSGTGTGTSTSGNNPTTGPHIIHHSHYGSDTGTGARNEFKQNTHIAQEMEG